MSYTPLGYWADLKSIAESERNIEAHSLSRASKRVEFAVRLRLSQIRPRTDKDRMAVAANATQNALGRREDVKWSIRVLDTGDLRIEMTKQPCTSERILLTIEATE